MRWTGTDSGPEMGVDDPMVEQLPPGQILQIAPKQKQGHKDHEPGWFTSFFAKQTDGMHYTYSISPLSTTSGINDTINYGTHG